jgi:peptidoglycan-N-acetylglucosamine deacetylase
MAERHGTLARFRAAPQWLAIGAAALVVVLAAVVTAVLAPGSGHRGGPGTAAAVLPGAGTSAGTPDQGKTHGTGPSATGSPAGSGTAGENDGKGGGNGGGPGGTPGIGQGGIAPVPDSIQHATEASGPAVSITIDDGPDPVWTPRVLKVLRDHHVHATFCMIGPEARAHPEIVKEVVAEGHRLCDHSVHHDTTMDHKPFAYQKSEIMDALAMIEQASGGARVYYYRAPGGAFTPPSRALAAQHGMRPLGWNVDTKDFERPGVATIVGTLKSEIHNGPTILFHDGGGNRSQTVAALDQSLTWLKGQGYAFSFPKVD